MNCVGFTINPPKEGWSRCSGQRPCKYMNNVLISHGDTLQQSPWVLFDTAKPLVVLITQHTEDNAWDLFTLGVVVGLPRQVHHLVLDMLSFWGNVTLVNGEKCCWWAEHWAVFPRCCHFWTCAAKQPPGCWWARCWQGWQPSVGHCCSCVSFSKQHLVRLPGKH